MQRFLDILRDSDIIDSQQGRVTRSTGQLPSDDTSDLLTQLTSQFPQYKPEIDLMNLTGPLGILSRRVHHARTQN